MNDQQLEKKVNHDAGKVGKDLSALAENRVSQLSKEIEKMTGDAKEIVIDTTAKVKKSVGHGLSQYNAKAQDVANKVPDGFSKKVAQYPWVVISIGLVLGFLLGLLINPAPQAS